MAIKEHFNTIHFSQGISLFRTLKLKFPQFRFSTNSFNSLIMSYHQYLTIVNFQHTRSGFLFFDLFIFYPIIHDFFQLLRLLTTLHRSKPDRTTTKHWDYFRVYTGSSFIHMRKLGFTLGPLRVYFVGVHFKHRCVKKASFPKPSFCM